MVNSHVRLSIMRMITHWQTGKEEDVERHFRQDSISMKRLMPYFFIGPALLALVALVVYPLLYGVYISFFKTNLANKWDFVGLKNYISVFQTVYL